MSGSRWVIFSSLSFILIELPLWTHQVPFPTILTVWKQGALFAPTYLRVCMFVLMFVSEWRILEEVSTRFRTTMVCSILKNTWNCSPSCLPSLMAVDGGALSKSHIDIPTHGYTRIDARPRSGNRLGLSLSVSVWRLTVSMARLLLRGHSQLAVQTFET